MSRAKNAAAGAFLAVCAVTSVPCAAADDNSYLIALGMGGLSPWINTDTLITAGHAICADLRAGMLKQDEVYRFWRQYPHVLGGAVVFVDAANQELCPDVKASDQPQLAHD